MTHQEVRQKFIDFFEKQGHKLVPSSSLIPDDPSVLFTSAGVQQLKKYYTGESDSIKDFGTKRLISIQKSLRTTDIDEVGDTSHGTFFEMLGYFSFGDYFKKETIEWTYDFLVNILGFSKVRIKPTIFGGDDQAPFDKESFETWKSLGFEGSQIGLGGKKDNFWGPVGDEGPCGPANEIYVDGIEIGTLVFNEYFCDKDKNLIPLKQNGVDVGLGFERILIFIQKATSVYETDLFSPIMTEIHGKKLTHDESITRFERIIADHMKASTFMIADGVEPSNTDRGYILRRLLRRIIRYAKLLNLSQDFYGRGVKTIINLYREFYPELGKSSEKILNIFGEEFEKFEKLLNKNIPKIEKEIEEYRSKGYRFLPGTYVFSVQSSLGIGIEIVRDIARDKGMDINVEELKEAEKKHQEKSRASAEKKFGTQ